MDNLTKLDYTLRVMKRQREKLWKDCLRNDYDLMHGLREEMPEAHRLYCERYRLMWIDAHWNAVTAFAEAYQLSEKERNDLYLYFAKYFRTYVEQLSFPGAEHTVFFSSLMKNQIHFIDALLDVIDNTEETMNELKNLHEVDRSKYYKKICQLKESEEMKNGSK